MDISARRQFVVYINKVYEDDSAKFNKIIALGVRQYC